MKKRNLFIYQNVKFVHSDSLLKIRMNPLNFSISYQCEKDSEHKNEKIYIETFNRFYLVKKIPDTCSICNKCGDFFFCNECEKYYCLNRFEYDKTKNKHSSSEKNKRNISLF